MGRKRELILKQEQAKLMICNYFTVILASAAIALIGYRSKGGSAGGEGDFFGGYMLSPEIGGYVLVALLAFGHHLVQTVVPARCAHHHRQVQVETFVDVLHGGGGHGEVDGDVAAAQVGSAGVPLSAVVDGGHHLVATLNGHLLNGFAHFSVSK